MDLPWSWLYELTPRDLQVTRFQRLFYANDFQGGQGASHTYEVPTDRVLLLQAASMRIRIVTPAATVSRCRAVIRNGTREYELWDTESDLPAGDEARGGEHITLDPGSGKIRTAGPIKLDLVLMPEDQLFFESLTNTLNAHVTTIQYQGVLIPRGNFAF